MKITLWVPGHARPKGRARSTREGRHYTPSTTKDYEHRLALIGAEKMAGRPLMTKPLAVQLIVRVPVPKSWPAWKKAAAYGMFVLPQGPRDLDNFIKTLDGLNGIIWEDDSQIAMLHAMRAYALAPGMQVTIQELNLLGPKSKQSELHTEEMLSTVELFRYATKTPGEKS